MVERVSGTIPQFMINQAPPDVKEMFDDRGRVKAELVAPDRQSRVSRLMLLPVCQLFISYTFLRKLTHALNFVLRICFRMKGTKICSSCCYIS